MAAQYLYAIGNPVGVRAIGQACSSVLELEFNDEEDVARIGISRFVGLGYDIWIHNPYSVCLNKVSSTTDDA